MLFGYRNKSRQIAGDEEFIFYVFILVFFFLIPSQPNAKVTGLENKGRQVGIVLQLICTAHAWVGYVCAAVFCFFCIVSDCAARSNVLLCFVPGTRRGLLAHSSLDPAP